MRENIFNAAENADEHGMAIEAIIQAEEQLKELLFIKEFIELTELACQAVAGVMPTEEDIINPAGLT